MQPQPGPRRWHEQRWIIDSVLRTDGLDDPPSWAERFNPKGSDVEEQAPLISRVVYDEPGA